jgi:hypothetical protein
MGSTRRKPGRMGPYIDAFEACLLEGSYTPGTVRNALKELGHLGRWMTSMDLEVSQLDEASLCVFLGARRAAGTRRAPSRRSLGACQSLNGLAGLVAAGQGCRRCLDNRLQCVQTWADPLFGTARIAPAPRRDLQFRTWSRLRQRLRPQPLCLQGGADAPYNRQRVRSRRLMLMLARNAHPRGPEGDEGEPDLQDVLDRALDVEDDRASILPPCWWGSQPTRCGSPGRPWN